MPQDIGSITVVVREYDEAIAFFTQALGFQLIEDTDLGQGKRWVLVAPPGSAGTNLLLARAAGPEQATRIGNQTGGRVFLFLHTDNFWRDYRAMKERGVKFRQNPREEAYGTVRLRGPLRQQVGPAGVEEEIGVTQSSRSSEMVYNFH